MAETIKRPLLRYTLLSLAFHTCHGMASNPQVTCQISQTQCLPNQLLDVQIGIQQNVNGVKPIEENILNLSGDDEIFKESFEASEPILGPLFSYVKGCTFTKECKRIMTSLKNEYTSLKESKENSSDCMEDDKNTRTMLAEFSEGVKHLDHIIFFAKQLQDNLKNSLNAFNLLEKIKTQVCIAIKGQLKKIESQDQFFDIDEFKNNRTLLKGKLLKNKIRIKCSFMELDDHITDACHKFQRIFHAIDNNMQDWIDYGDSENDDTTWEVPQFIMEASQYDRYAQYAGDAFPAILSPENYDKAHAWERLIHDIPKDGSEVIRKHNRLISQLHDTRRMMQKYGLESDLHVQQPSAYWKDYCALVEKKNKNYLELLFLVRSNKFVHSLTAALKDMESLTHNTDAWDDLKKAIKEAEALIPNDDPHIVRLMNEQKIIDQELSCFVAETIEKEIAYMSLSNDAKCTVHQPTYKRIRLNDEGNKREAKVVNYNHTLCGAGERE